MISETVAPREKQQVAQRGSRLAFPSFIYSSAGWIEGTFPVPPIHSFGDWLDHAGDFINLVDVTLPTGSEIPFFALQREAIVMVAPKGKLERPEYTRYLLQNTTPHNVTVLLPGGVIEGTIFVLSDVRVSDFLAMWPRFIPIHDAVVTFRDPTAAMPLPSPVPLLFLNAPQVIGFVEGD